MRYDWASVITPSSFQIWHKNYQLDWKRPKGLDKVVYIELNKDYQCVIQDVPDRLLKCFNQEGSPIQFIDKESPSSSEYIAKDVSHVSCVSELKFCCWVVSDKQSTSVCSGFQTHLERNMRKYIPKFKQEDADYISRQIEQQDGTFIDCRHSENQLTTCIIHNDAGRWILPGRDIETKDVRIRNHTICVTQQNSSSHCRSINKENKDFAFLEVPLKLRNNIKQIEGTLTNTFCQIDNEQSFNCQNPIIFKKPSKIPADQRETQRLELERQNSNVDEAKDVIDFASWEDSYCILFKTLDISCREFAHAPYAYKNHIKNMIQYPENNLMIENFYKKLGQIDLPNYSSQDEEQGESSKSERVRRQESRNNIYDSPEKRDHHVEIERQDNERRRRSSRFMSRGEGSSKEIVLYDDDALSDNETRDMNYDNEDYMPSRTTRHSTRGKEADDRYKHPFKALDQQYLVLIDFKHVLSSLEIIEFSPVILNLRTNKIDNQIEYFVKPTKKIEQELKDKTGISQSDVDKSDPWPVVYHKVNKWLTDKLGKNSWVFVTDGFYDLKVIFPEQMNIYKDLEIHDQQKQQVNIQDIFVKDPQFRKSEELKKFNHVEMSIYLNKQNKLNVEFMLNQFRIDKDVKLKRGIDQSMSLAKVCQAINRVNITFHNYVQKINLKRDRVDFYESHSHVLRPNHNEMKDLIRKIYNKN